MQSDIFHLFAINNKYLFVDNNNIKYTQTKLCNIVFEQWNYVHIVVFL